jgi:predicted amidohydrolase YtcJ
LVVEYILLISGRPLKRALISLALAAVIHATACAQTASITTADLVLSRGKVWTVDKNRPQSAAVAISQGRIHAVGSDTDVAPLIGANTKVIDLQGRRVLPGLIDSHIHLLGAGRRLSEVALKDVKDEAEFGRRLREFDRKLPADRWMTGGEWDHDRALGGKLPDAALIDKYVPKRPVFLNRYDGHMAVCNAAALRMAGITAATTDPAGGVIYRKTGTQQPTGLLRDTAMGLVSRLVPALSDEEIVEGVRAALAEIRAAGVTTVEDMAGHDRETQRKLFLLYQKLAREGQLTVRVNLRWPLEQWRELLQFATEAQSGNQWVRIAGVKGFMDGSLGSSTAKMYEPYLNEPDSTGVFVTQPSRMLELVQQADQAGISVAIHAIGDRANAELLDIFAEVLKRNGPRDRRFRIEHAQHLRPQDYSRFAKLGVIASMQPYHVIDDGRWAEGRIGPQRCNSSYAFRSLLDAGAKMAFGSDWSVAPIDALVGIDAAINRATLDGKHSGGWFPEQRITVAEAIEAYTLGAAFASFQDDDRGSITPGKLADLVVLSHDIMDGFKTGTAPKVALTIVGGKVVYEAKENGSDWNATKISP